MSERRWAVARAVAAVALGLAVSACPREKREADGGLARPSASDGAAAAPGAEATASVDVTSGASPGWTPGPSVVTQGSVDAEGLRARNRARLRSDRSAVTLLQGSSPRDLGQRLCEAVVPRRPAGTPVLIKPNLGGFEWFKDPQKSGGDDGLRGRITDPEFVRGIVRCLKARGHDRITLAEGWGARHADWERLLRASGYEAMAREEQVRLVAMDDDGVFDVQGDTPGKPLGLRGMEGTRVPTLLIPRILAEHLDRGLFISAPKIKAHRFGVFSVGIKGTQGTVMLSDASPAFHQKWRMHRELGAALALGKKGDPGARAAYVKALEAFAERIADVLEVEAPHAVLAEGAPAMGGDGFGKQYPSAEKVAIGGTNVVLVDRVAAQFLGLWDSDALARELGGHRTSPLLESAARRLGVDLTSPRIQGDGASLLARPRPSHLVGMAGFEIHSGAGEADGGAPASREEPAKEIHAARLPEGSSLVLDGKREEAWSRATPVRWDTDWSGKATGTFTSARLLWDRRALYVLWELEGAGLLTDRSRPRDVERPRLYEEDCVELFLTPDPSRRKRYFEVEIGPFGHFFDIDVDREKKREDTGWSSQPEIGTSRDPAARRATIEVALRAPELVRSLSAGARLPAALYRMEGKGERLYLAQSPTRTPRPNFHVPEAFGALVLDP